MSNICTKGGKNREALICQKCYRIKYHTGILSQNDGKSEARNAI